MRQLETYLENVSGGGTLTGGYAPGSFSNVCIHLLPMANPDGVTVSESDLPACVVKECNKSSIGAGNRIRELRRTSQPIEQYLKTFKANANGVDLKKNFDIGWSGYTDGVPVPSTDCYRGGAAASEPETQAIPKAVKAIRQSVSSPIIRPEIRSTGITVLPPGTYWNRIAIAESVRNLTGYALSNSKIRSCCWLAAVRIILSGLKVFRPSRLKQGTGNCRWISVNLPTSGTRIRKCFRCLRRCTARKDLDFHLKKLFPEQLNRITISARIRKNGKNRKQLRRLGIRL